MIRMTLIGGRETVARFQSVSQQIYDNLRAVIQEQWFGLQAYIVTNKLSGQVLKRRTGLLASSINVGGPQSTSEFTADETYIVGKVGTAVQYAAIHEYGGSVTVKAHESHRGSTAFNVRSYTAHYPERSFLRSGLQDRQAQIRGAIQAAYDMNMKKLNG
jgi:phage gpG-like protein